MLDSAQISANWVFPTVPTKIRTSRRRSSDGTHHCETASGLRAGKDEPAAADSKPGPGGNGSRQRNAGSRGRYQSSPSRVYQPCFLSGGRLREDTRFLRGSVRDEGFEGRRKTMPSLGGRFAHLRS